MYNLLLSNDFGKPDHNLCHKWLVESFLLFGPPNDVVPASLHLFPFHFCARKLLRPIIDTRVQDFMRSQCFQSNIGQFTSASHQPLQ